ncbi:MAG: 2-hydroxyacyl-CoA dehydratase [Deltaproteobacteria bacterium]|nr:2-hydroxyacyl-CoA dehydratase [Deltaproteobacteria bacterium]
MRKESREYNYDWNLWTIVENASRAYDGFEKEYQHLLSLIPNFRGVLEAFVRHGEPGILFLKLLASYTRNCIQAYAEGRKIAASTFCFAAPILYAFDVQPLILEPWSVFGTVILQRGTGEFMDYCCELGFTETSCSSQRGALGAYLAGLGVDIDFIICDSPGICDTNANSFSFASAYLDIPFFQLNFPPTLTDERARRYHRQDFHSLIEFLEKQTGKKLDLSRLSQIIEHVKRQDELAIELMELQRLIPCPMPPIYDLFLYSGRFLMSGTSEYSELLEAMLAVTRKNSRLGIAGTTSTREKARGLFCYIDHYTTDVRFWDWLDSHEISHMGSILYNFWQADNPQAHSKEEQGYCIDDHSLEGMIDSLADQVSRMPMVKSIRGPYDAPGMWLDDTLGAASLLKTDFVVYIGTMGCRNTWGMVKPFTRDLERYGIPCLVLYADAFDDRIQSWEAITDRMDEFMKLRRIGAH